MPASGPSDDGFSLVEVAISTMVVVVFFLAFAGSLETATDSLALSRTHAQASSIVSQELEYARSVEWDALSMSSVDSGAPLLVSGQTALDGAAAGLNADEPLVVEATGSILPRSDHSSENTDFIAWRFVTEVGSDLRRVLVVVEWTIEDRTHSLQSSTTISEFGATGRGSGITTTSVSGS